MHRDGQCRCTNKPQGLWVGARSAGDCGPSGLGETFLCNSSELEILYSAHVRTGTPLTDDRLVPKRALRKASHRLCLTSVAVSMRALLQCSATVGFQLQYADMGTLHGMVAKIEVVTMPAHERPWPHSVQSETSICFIMPIIRLSITIPKDLSKAVTEQSRMYTHHTMSKRHTLPQRVMAG